MACTGSASSRERARRSLAGIGRGSRGCACSGRCGASHAGGRRAGEARGSGAEGPPREVSGRIKGLSVLMHLWLRVPDVDDADDEAPRDDEESKSRDEEESK